MKEREEAARVRVERLQGELAALNVQIAAAEDELSRLEITRETLATLGGEHISPALQFESSLSGDANPDDLSAPVPPVVNLATGEVPAEGDWPVLALLARTDVPLRAKQICEQTGETVDHRHIETLRMRLKRMVRHGWLDEPERGLFALADSVRAPVQP
ncbi:hypothetical protein OHS81_06150 [Streptomyces sp. NBC_00400]|uniref:hypothetical protein n=1 Tax=Streptomyces sp. NBC_00400 TaxID=2975737 RepID=UPI002E1B8386